MTQGEAAVRAEPGPAGFSAPGSHRAAPPSRAALAELIAADALSEPGVVAVEGGPGVGKTAMVDLVAARLRGGGRLVVPVAGPSSHPLTPPVITNILLLASGIPAGGGDTPPDHLLRSLLAQPGLRDLVLLIDDADAMAPGTWRFLDLLLGLAQFGRTRLRLVLFGAPGRWPGPGTLHRLGSGRTATRVIEPLSPAEAAHDAAAAEQTGPMPHQARLDHIPDSADGGLAQLDAVLPRTAVRLRRRVWPAFAVAVPAVAAVVALAVLASRPTQAPAGAPPAAVASAEVAPTRAGSPRLPAVQPATPLPPAVQLPGAVASGKANAGAAALGLVLARVDAAGLAAAQRNTPAVQPLRAPSPAPVVSREPPQPAPDLAPVRGLLLVARPGDTLATLYSEVYRGRSAPPFADISAANPVPVRPGTLVVFPAPPGGWSRTDVEP